MKSALEAQFGEPWHVVVGQSYGASVAHEAGMMVSFRLGRVTVTAFASYDEATLVRPRARPRPAAGAGGGGGSGAAPGPAGDEDDEAAGGGAAGGGPAGGGATQQ